MLCNTLPPAPTSLSFTPCTHPSLSFGELGPHGVVGPEELMRKVLRIVLEQQVRAMRFWQELLTLEDPLHHHSSVGKLLVS